MRNNSTWVPSALSPIPWPSNAWNVWATLAAFIIVIILNVVPAIVYVVIYAAYRGAIHHPIAEAADFPPIQALIAQIVTYVPIAAFLLLVLPAISKVSLAHLGIRRPTMGELGAGVVGAVAMWIVTAGVGGAVAALTHRHDTENAVIILKALKSPVQLTLFVLVACVFAPIVEELTFRVFIFNSFTKWAPLTLALVASGLLFGAVHAASDSWAKFFAQCVTIGLPIACGGVVLAYVYARTHCYWSSVTTHACFNAVNLIALVVFHAS